ncbi:MAG: M48 family metalloprotease [Gemmatimonadaceae bacterium]|nr:M48 family metalloprotease [Gemmatimonadaceae bacterium]
MTIQQAIHRKTHGRGWPFPAALLVLAAVGCAVSQQQEVQMGQQYAAQIQEQLPIVRDPEIVRYINVLGDSLASVTDDRSLQWHFYVVDQMEINAFALPGGYIFVNRGLIERAKTMSEVAGVIGHEIGHVTRRHSIKQMQKAQGANVGVTLACILTNVCSSDVARTGIDLAAGGLFARFSRDDEAEADAEGVKTVIKAGIDPRGIPAMFRILLDERKQQPGAVETFFASHPLEESRIAATDALIAKYPPAQLKGLTVDSPNFEAFKARLKSLPPSPPPRKR